MMGGVTASATKVYQPIWIKGVKGNRFQRECSDRYQPIRELASRFNRPFSVLDIGANYGYFDFRLMEEFDCTCIMVDRKLIMPLIKGNEVENRAVWINRHIDAETLKSLSKCEHFDIVLGLAVLHHFENPALAYEAMCDLGSYTFFEIPGDDDFGATHPERHRMIKKLFENEIPIDYFPSHVSSCKRPWYLIESDPVLIEQRLDAADADAPQHSRYFIDNDFDKSVITIKRAGAYTDNEVRDYVPGMNAWNFKLLGGGHPSQSYIEDEMEKTKEVHKDWKQWNYILGYGIKPIDEMY